MANPEHLDILKQGIEVWNKWRQENLAIQPVLVEANLIETELTNANLSNANLYMADLSKANLVQANLKNAYLRNTKLNGTIFLRASLIMADLAETKFRGANLHEANLNGAFLSNANLEGAYIHGTIFANIDLSETKGLDRLVPSGPSIVDHRALMKSENLPKKFLRDCGLPDQFIDYLPSLIGSLEPIQFYSCFISYSAKDKEFANRLYADLQAKGIRCWYSPENLKIGDEISPTIDKAIRVHEKLLLIFSDNSITSAWVKKEAKEAMATEEDKGKKDVLFPIRLDDSIMDTTEQWCSDVKRERHIGDFRNWKDHDAYQKSFERLLRDLGKVWVDSPSLTFFRRITF